MKKLSTTLKVTIIVSVFAVVFLALAIASAFASPYRAEKAINEIGTVAYTDECKAKIDTAISYYNDIGKNTLGESSLVGTAYISATSNEQLETTLKDAKRAYVTLAIKNAIVSENRKYVENYSHEDLVAIFASARAVLDSYCSGCTDFENYEEFATLEKTYSAASDSQSNSNDNSSSEEIELC